MAIVDILNKLTTLLPEDSGEAKALLADAKREVQTIMDDLKSANGESKSRKERIRELQAELEEKGDFTETEKKLKAEIERLRKVESDYNQFRQAEDDKIVNAWQEKAKLFEIDETDKRHPKIQAVKGDFNWAEDGKTLTAAEARDNLAKYGLLEKAGAFAIPDEHTPNPHPPTPGKPQDGQPQFASSGAAIAAQLYGKK